MVKACQKLIKVMASWNRPDQGSLYWYQCSYWPVTGLGHYLCRAILGHNETRESKHEREEGREREGGERETHL